MRTKIIDQSDCIRKRIGRNNFRDLLKHSEKTAQKLWNNEEDKIWDSQ